MNKGNEIPRRTIVECRAVHTVIECGEEDTQLERFVRGTKGARVKWSQLGIVYGILVGINCTRIA
jgi:hypothetical protein